MGDETTKQQTCLQAALSYAKKGVYVFPGKPGTRMSYKSMKFSSGRRWGMTIDAAEIKADWKRWPDANVCIVTGEQSGIWVLDVDTLAGHGKDGPAALAALEAQRGALPRTKIAESPSGSRHYYFRWPKQGNIINSDSKVGPGLDVRGEGGMVVAPPSIKPDAGVYKWVDGSRMAQAPEWLLEMVIDKDMGAQKLPGEAQASIEKVAAALDIIPNDNVSWEEWNTVGMAAWAATGGHEQGYAAFVKWSAKSSKHNEGECRTAWFKRYAKTPPTSLGFGKLWYLANEEQPSWLAVWEEEHQIDEDELEPEEMQEAPDDDKSVKIVESEMRKAVARTQELLIKNNAKIYRHGHTLAYPVLQTFEAMFGHKTQIAQLKEIDNNYMTTAAHNILTFLKHDGRKRKWKPVLPPAKLVTMLLSDINAWQFPEVAGLISTPTMRPDGSLFLQSGYDPATRMLMINPPTMPAIADKPSRGDALAAIEIIENLLSEFPFAEDISLAVALSAIITPVCRGAFPVTPMHVNRAPVAASGKSYLFDVVAAVAIGQRMPVMAAGQNDEETEKRLGSALMAGQPLINIDNVNGELGGDALCQIIERPIVNIRVLGKSELKTIEARGTSLFCTGNNITLVGDVTRRALQSTLNPNLERPELREFKKDPVAMVMADRGKYIAACLTIVKAYMTAGSPNKCPRLGSFEQWSDTVRSALVWLGKADPVLSMESVRADDPQLIEHRLVLSEWASIIGEGYQQRVTVSAVIETAEEAGDSGYDEYNHKWTGLNAAVAAVAKYRQHLPPDVKKFSYWLRGRKDKIVDGLVLRSDSNPKGGSKWWVERIVAGQPQPPKPGLRDAPNVVGKPSFGDR